VNNFRLALTDSSEGS